MPKHFPPVTVHDRNGKPRTFYPTQQRNPYGAAAMNRMLREVYVNTFDVLGGMAWLTEFVRKSDENARLFVSELSKQCRMPLDAAAQDGGLVINIVSLAGPSQPLEIKLPKEPARAPVPALTHARTPEEQER